MKLKDLIYSDCSLCRTLRASICAGAIIVLATYMLQLLNINREMRGKESQKDERNELEHCLQSFVDFTEYPTIAGDTSAAMDSYASALRKKARALLGYQDER